jgi:hypothetical protein
MERCLARLEPVTAESVRAASREALAAALRSEIAAHYRVEAVRRPDSQAFLKECPTGPMQATGFLTTVGGVLRSADSATAFARQI